MPDRLLQAFSSRSAEIAAAMQGLVARFTDLHGRTPGRAEVLQLRQQATRQSRPGKTLHALSDLLARWRAHAVDLLGAAAVDALGAGVPRRAPSLHASDVEVDAVNALAAATVAGVQARRSTWTRWNLLAEAARATRHLRLTGTVERLTLLDRVVETATARQCLTLDPPVRPADPLLAGHLVPAGPVPPGLHGDELRASLTELERLIATRVQALVAGVLAAPPAWARPLGPPPATPAVRSAWIQHVGTISAYRELYGLSDADPLAPAEDADLTQWQAYRRAIVASRVATELARHVRWAPRSNLHPHPGRDLDRAPGR